MTPQPPVLIPERNEYDDLLDSLPADGTAGQPGLTAPQAPAGEPPARNEYDDLLDSQQHQAERQLALSFGAAVKSNPDLAGEAQRLGMQMDLSPDVVERNIDKVRQLYAVRQARLQQLAGGDSVLARHLTDPAFARIAHDSVHQLGFLEGVLQNFEAGQLTTERGLLYEKVRQGTATPADQFRLQEVNNRLQVLPTKAGNPVSGPARFLGQMATSVGRAAEVGAAGAGTALLLGQAGPQAAIPEELLSVPGMFSAGFFGTLTAHTMATEAGLAYGDMIEAGYSKDAATRAAFGVGLVNGVLEVAGEALLARGLTLAAKPLRAALTGDVVEQALNQALVKPTNRAAALELAKGWLTGVGGEVSTEVLQEAVSVAAEEIVRRASDNPHDLQSSVTRGEVLGRLWDTAAQTLMGVALLAAPGPVATFAHEQARVRASEAAGKQFAEWTKAAAELKVRERNPAATEAFVRDAAAGTEAENVFVDGKRFEAALQQLEITREQLAQQLPDLPDLGKQVDDAVAAGGYVVIPAEKWATYIAPQPELGKVLLQHAKFDPDGLTIAETQAYRQDEVERVQEMVRAAEQHRAANDAFRESGDRVQQALLRQIADTKVIRATEGEALARFARAFFETVAISAQRTPEQVHAAYPLQIVKGKFVVPEEALQQPDAQRDSFEQRFLEQSRIVGAAEKQSGLSRRDGESWQDFSRRAGYSEQEIADFQKWLELNDEGQRLGYSLEDLQGLMHNGKPAEKLQAPRGRAAFDPKTLTAILYEKADASSVLHEFGHFFLTVYEDLAAQPNAPAQVQKDMQVLLDWFGVKDIDTWRAMSLEEKRKHHEAFAYSFEIWMFEGKAPSRGLADIFHRFTAWLRRIYGEVIPYLSGKYREKFGTDLPMLTPEVRGVFGRMLASDEAIAEAQAVNNMVPLFQTQEEAVAAGMDPDTWTFYRESAQMAEDVAKAELQRKSLRQMQWLRGSRSRILKELQAEHRAVREQVRAEVAAEFEFDPVTRARKALQTVKLSAKAVEQLLPEDRRAALRRRLKDHLAADGLPPDVVAEQTGFNSGEAMVKALLTAPSTEDAIEAATDKRMLEEHSELADPKARERAVEEALHNEARQRFVAVELQHASKATVPFRQTLAAAKEAARQILERKTVREIQPHLFVAGEARAAREAADAMRVGEESKVLDAKRRQLVQGQLARQSFAVREEVQRARAGFDKVWRSNKDLAKNHNVDLVKAAQAILSMHGLGAIDDTPMVYLAKVRAYDPDLYAELEPLLIDAANVAATSQRDYRDLTLQRFRDMRDVVEHLWFRSLRDQQFVIEGKKLQRAQIVGELTQTIAGRVPSELPGGRQRVTARQKGMMTLATVKAAMRRVEHWTRAMDGGRAGAFSTYLFREVRKRADDYRHDKNNYVKRMRDLVVRWQLPSGKIEAPEIDYTFANKAELLGAMQHAGNANGPKSNLWRLLVGGRGKGYQWGTVLEDGTLDRSQWDQLVARLIRDGVLVKQDFDNLQAMWDLNEELKPRAQKTLHSVSGYYFEEITATPIATPWGVYRGGYVPAVTDPKLVPEAAQRQGLEGLGDLERDTRQMMPTASKGFTKGRVEGYARPLLLDLGANVRHLDQVVRFINMGPVIKDVAAILRDREFVDTMNEVDATAIGEVLVPWLERTARQQVAKTTGIRALDTVFSFLRRSSGLSIMFGNVTNAAQQVTGLANALVYVKARHLASANLEYWGTRKITDKIAGMSRYMDERLRHQVGQMIDDIDLALDPSWWATVQSKITQHGYFLQRFAQNHVDQIVWLGAYKQTLEKTKATMTDEEAHAAAVDEADSIVRLSQGSTSPEDVARFEASNTFARLFLQFTGYFSVVLNQIGSAQKGDRVRTAILAFSIPTILGSAIQTALSGGWDDSDDDGSKLDDAAWKLLVTEQLRAAPSLIPGFGPALTSLISSGGDRLALSPAFSAGQSAVRGIEALLEKGISPSELGGRDIRDLSTALAMLVGVPVNALGNRLGYLRDVETGRKRPSGPVDYGRGILTGR